MVENTATGSKIFLCKTPNNCVSQWSASKVDNDLCRSQQWKLEITRNKLPFFELLLDFFVFHLENFFEGAINMNQTNYFHRWRTLARGTGGNCWFCPTLIKPCLWTGLVWTWPVMNDLEADPGGRLGRLPLLKPRKVILFAMIFYNSQKQHSGYKAILSSIVLSQYCEVCFISLTIANPREPAMRFDYWILLKNPPSKLTGWIRPGTDLIWKDLFWVVCHERLCYEQVYFEWPVLNKSVPNGYYVSVIMWRRRNRHTCCLLQLLLFCFAVES